MVVNTGEMMIMVARLLSSLQVHLLRTVDLFFEAMNLFLDPCLAIDPINPDLFVCHIIHLFINLFASPSDHPSFGLSICINDFPELAH